jgi:flavin reductase (DIM6/NTAB) family NADH-FMN oxidoreductase RutF
MYYDPRTEPHGLARDPITALVVPRPIGWISTVGPGGIINLAPYSFFNLVSSRPPFVLFASNPRKNSQVNAEAAGEFTASMATWDLREQMNATGAALPPDISEPEAVGLEMAPSRAVKPPRVARSPIALECRYSTTVPLVRSTGEATESSLIIGEVVGVHIDDSVIVDGFIDIHRIRPISRLGYMDYAAVDDVFSMKMPGYGRPAAG